MIRRVLNWMALGLAAMLLLGAAFLALGFVPRNVDYALPAAGERVLLYVRSSDIHTDIVMPVVDEQLGVDWRELFPPEHFRGAVDGDRYVAVGWGDRRFFMETPEWSDLTVGNVFRALLVPSDSVLFVQYLPDASADEWTVPVYVSRRQYEALVEYVRGSVRALDEDGAAVAVGDFSYGSRDRFYYATGSYHLFNTCNQWTGRGLREAGVPTGLWTPLTTHVQFWLPRHELPTAGEPGSTSDEGGE